MKPNIFKWINILIISICLFGCKTEDNDEILLKEPIVSTNKITDIDIPYSICGGVVINDGGSPIVEQGICWSTQNSIPTIEDSKTTENIQNSSFSSPLSNLQKNLVYYVRAYARNKGKIGYGNVQVFKAIPKGTFSVNTLAINNIQANKADVRSLVTNNGAAPILIQGLCWSTDTLPTLTNSKISVSTDSTSFTATINNLEENQKYYVRAFAINKNDTAYGNIKSFTTLIGLSLSTNYVTNIKSESADVNATITNNGVDIIEQGICYSTTQTPTIKDNKQTISTTNKTFDVSINNLTENTVYYVRTYATYNKDTVYGDIKSFTTPTTLILSTPSISNIDISFAIANCTITNNSNKPILEKGLCWSKNGAPTIADNVIISTLVGNQILDSLKNLEPNTSYYVKAYAKIGSEVYYSNEINFTTLDGVIDYDGNVYHIVKIGNQTWLAENLKVTHYNDGTPIPNITDDNAWFNLSSDAYCWYNNDISLKDRFGGLYNFAAVNTGILAPKGWHIPTDEEWTTLGNYLGSSAGGELKQTGTINWASPNTGATNSTGFNAVGARARGSSTSGAFLPLYLSTTFWSSTVYNNQYAWYRSIYANAATLNRFYGERLGGMYVRCIKD